LRAWQECLVFKKLKWRVVMDKNITLSQAIEMAEANQNTEWASTED